MNRRQFLGSSAVVAGALGSRTAEASPAQPTRKQAPALPRKNILNFNEKMEYRRLGTTNLLVSAICLGGHWKRVGVMIGQGFKGAGFMKEDNKNLENPAFLKNRHEVVSRCIELGINYVDACSPQEILAYSKVLKGRRDKMYFGFSWHVREPRYEEWRSAKRLMEGFDMSLKEAGLDYVDVWRISLPMEAISDLSTLLQVEEATVGALEQAKKQGKARFTGVSSHNRTWLKNIIEQYPKQIEVVLFPYTANSKELPGDSVFDAIKAKDVGVFGIKPFADNSLFAGDSSPASSTREEDDRRARLALRYILGNPAVTAPIPGLINIHQVENAVRAVAERRQLDRKEKAELERLSRHMWANLRPDHRWLRDWEYV
jgi:aryl-alcohol dehydrogenase-like predicted oxidoreductase